jgi:opacity protein-like surface antigen
VSLWGKWSLAALALALAAAVAAAAAAGGGGALDAATAQSSNQCVDTQLSHNRQYMLGPVHRVAPRDWQLYPSHRDATKKSLTPKPASICSGDGTHRGGIGRTGPINI